jgi:hypothetical protein
LAVGTGADAAAKLSLGASGTVLQSNGSTAVWANISKTWTEIIKASDDSVVSSTVFVSDSELTFTPVSGAFYEFEFQVFYASAGTSINYKFQIAVPTGDGLGNYYYPNTSNIATASMSQGNGTAIPGNNAALATSSGVRCVLFKGIFAPTSTTAFAWQMAQSASNGTAVKTKAGSALHYRRLA